VTRPRAATALVVLSAVLLFATAVTAYAWRTLFDSDQFAARAASALQDDRVRQAIGDRITDELVLEADPDLLAARPAIAAVVARVVGGDAFASLFRGGVRDVHAAVFRQDQDTVTLTLADVGLVVAAALRALEPQLAAKLEAGRGVTLVTHDLGDAGAELARIAERVRWAAILLALLTLAAMGGALALGGDRRRTATHLGFALVGAGVAIVAAEAVARAVALGAVPDDDREVAGAVLDAYLGDLRSGGLVVAAAGAVLAAAASSLIRPVEVDEPLRRAWHAVSSEPRSPLLRAARGVALIAAGVLLIAEPAAAVRIVLTLAGVYVLYKGLEVLLRLIGGPEPEARPRPRPRLRRLLVPALGVVAIAGGATAFAAGGGVSPAVQAATGCNGHAELCDRPLDEVVLPATHNAMSVPLPGWFSSLQERPIPGQLEDGIRGLLLDTHYADRLPNGRIRTDLDDPDERRKVLAGDAVSDESVAAALRIRARLGFRGEGERGMYLCHTFCELGASPLGDVLVEIRDFLVTHPGEVLVIVNEDYVSPADFVGAMEEAGLAELAITPPAAGAPWPTLGGLIEQGKRLLVMAENEGGAAPWYQRAYDRLLQETPFTFTQPAQLTTPADLPATCEPNRGPGDAPLFLLNHWINTDPAPRPSHAAIVNAYEPLLRRARTCQELRGRLPNLLAVDFYGRGDVFRVADTLNDL
jgi:hypothetical protein